MKSVIARCNRCRMHQSLCICGQMPCLSTKTKVVVIVHCYEIGKPTNTGRLAADCLSNSELHIRGRLGENVDLSSLEDPERQPLVLFPSNDAVVLTKEHAASFGKPITLVVPDGNWRQAARMPKREPALINLPRVILPPGPPTQYRLRNEPKLAYGLATMEAIIRALAILEDTNVEDELARIFRVMVERTLWTKGKLPAAEVFGGLGINA